MLQGRDSLVFLRVLVDPEGNAALLSQLDEKTDPDRDQNEQTEEDEDDSGPVFLAAAGFVRIDPLFPRGCRAAAFAMIVAHFSAEPGGVIVAMGWCFGNGTHNREGSCGVIAGLPRRCARREGCLGHGTTPPGKLRRVAATAAGQRRTLLLRAHLGRRCRCGSGFAIEIPELGQRRQAGGSGVTGAAAGRGDQRDGAGGQAEDDTGQHGVVGVWCWGEGFGTAVRAVYLAGATAGGAGWGVADGQHDAANSVPMAAAARAVIFTNFMVLGW